MTKTFNISQDRVYKRVYGISEYVAANNAGTSYDGVRVTEYNREVLDEYWKGAMDTVANQLRRLVNVITSRPSGNDTVCVLILQLSASHDESLDESLGTSLETFFVDYILSKWFLKTLPDKSPVYAAEAKAALDDVTAKAFFKRRPDGLFYPGAHEVDPTVPDYVKTITEDDIDSWKNKQEPIEDLNEIREGAGEGASAYQKPSDGIPHDDLSEEVQESLDIAADLEWIPFRADNT